MNNSQGALHFGASIDTTQWKKDIETMRRDILGLNNTVRNETQQMDSSFKNLGIGIAGYLSASTLKGFVMELINVRGEFQKTEIAFSTMLKSQDKAKALMGDMVTLAAKTPFSLQEVSAGAKQLLAFQIPANQVVDTLTRMGNIAAGLGVPLSRINLVYGQVKAKGKLMGDDLRQFTEAGIPMVAELAKKFNKTTAEISGMVSAGKIGFKDVQDVLFSMTNEGGMFFNLMEKQSSSLSGKVANFGDSWDQMLNQIGEANEGILYGGIEGLTHLIEHYEEMFEIIKTLVIGYGSYKAAIIVMASAQAFSNKTLATEIGLLSVSQRWKLGRALVTEKQTAATLLEAQAEQASLSTKYATLQAEVSLLAVKKQKAVALGIERAQALGNARIQLALAQAELRSLQANGTAREVLIATKNVEKAQNTVIAAQDSASIARKAALTAGTQFYTAQKELEITATTLSSVSKNVETAAEVANAAAKSANTLATTRLTIAQTAQTIAMTAAARAATFLNATLFANPYALAAALIAALTYAIYKYSSALTQAEESQKRMDDDMKNQIPTITEQEVKLKSLIKVIGDHKSSEDLRGKSIKQIQSLTNGRLNQLDEEAVKTGKASGIIKEYIEMLKLEAEAKRYVNELGRLDSDVEELKNSKGNFGLGDMWDDFTDFDSSFKWNLKDRKKERVDRIVKEKEQEKKELQKRLDDLAKKGVNISETQINETTTPTAKKGWVQIIKDQISALEAEAESAPTRAAYLRIQAKIKELNDLINPKKEKKDNRQIAELLPLGSIAELERRAKLINDAVQVAVDGQVKLRKLDKYGKDKDKNGNPYLTGVTITKEQAADQIAEINALIEKNRLRTFEEQLAEDERQWNIRYQLARQYGEDIAKAQFPDLKGESYYDELIKKYNPLNDQYNAGIKLSDVDLKKWEALKKILDSLNGVKTPMENFKDGLDRQLANLETFAEKKAFLESQLYTPENLKNGKDNGQVVELNNRLSDLQKGMGAYYKNILTEQQTYEEKSAKLQAEYQKVKETKEYQNGSDLDRSKVDGFYKTQLGNIDADFIKSSKEWEAAFGEVEFMTQDSLQRILAKLLEFKEKSNGTLSLQDSVELERSIKRIRDAANRNPFKAIISGISDYRNALKNSVTIQKEVENAQSEYNSVVKAYGKESPQALLAAKKLREAQEKGTQADIDAAKAKQKVVAGFQDSQNIFNAVGQGVMELGDLFGGFDDATNDAIGNIMAIGNAALDLGKSIASGDVAGMIKAGIQLIASIGKALNGDQKKERNIKKQASALKELERAYNDLAYAAEKAFGSQKYTGQAGMIQNLEQQKLKLQQMINEEDKKKKTDQGKIDDWKSQIQSINQSIDGIKDSIIKDVLQTDVVDAAAKIGDALVDAFSRGEDQVKSLENAANDMIRNLLKNQLNLRLQSKMSKVLDDLFKATGLNPDGTGSFAGLTAQQIADFKAQVQAAGADMQSFMSSYSDIFGGLNANASSLEGAIKGMTSEEAGILAGQFNAIRINVSEILQMMKGRDLIGRESLQQLVMIEFNTRRLHNIDRNIEELNKKTKEGGLRAAGLI